MIFQEGSEIVTHKPGADSDSDIEVDTLNETTPRQQEIEQGKASTGQEPYETPVILRTKRWVPSAVQVDDTEVEDSEIEKVAKWKRKKATRVSCFTSQRC
jgi:hypothetical protein